MCLVEIWCGSWIDSLKKKLIINFFIVVFIFVKKLIDLLLFLNSVYLCAWYFFDMFV
jgi:hypothetical protein